VIKEKLMPVAFELIDWDTIKVTITTDLFNLWITKQVSGHCVVGKMMMHWKFLEESNCHSCYALVEDTCCWEK
jgi:hypothetical protein